VAIGFAATALESANRRRDVGLVAVLVHFLRVVVLSGEHKRQTVASQEGSYPWSGLVFALVEGTKILDNLQREEIAVCLTYYLCLKERSLLEAAIEAGILQYLIATLHRRFIPATFGKRIIEFLKYLLLHLDIRLAEQLDFLLFERALALFSARFDREEIITSIRDLVSIFEQKVGLVDHEQKLDHLDGLYQLFTEHRGQGETCEQLLEGLHVINLYINNERMGNLIAKYYPLLFSRMLQEQREPQVVKILAGFLSFNFKKGKLSQEAALQVIGKVDEVISDAGVRDTLLENRKQLLIGFVRVLKLVLENHEHHEKVTWAINAKQTENKLWDYSDCTNYLYEKELIELRRKLGRGKVEDLFKEVEVLQRLEQDIINKSKFNMNKLSWELYEEVRFMENLLNDQGTIPGFRPSAEIPLVVSNYIQTSNRKCTFSLLENIENEESEQLRKEFNLVCCKLLTKLIRNNKHEKALAEVKHKMIALTSSKDEIEDIYDMVNCFFQTEEEIQEEHERRQSTMRASRVEQEQLQRQIEFSDRVKTMLLEYFRAEAPFDITLMTLNGSDELSILIEEMAPYENEQDILKYLRVMMELVKKDSLCPSVYQALGGKLLLIYQTLGGRQGDGDGEVVVLIEAILLRLLRFHLKCLFNDHYDPNSVNYYLQVVAEIDEHFEFAFSQKRIELLELIMEYLECNMVESNHDYERLIKKEDRSEFIRSHIDDNKAEAIGISYGKLLSLNCDDEVHEAFWLQHKEHILRNLREGAENTAAIKFVQVYLAECEPFIFKEYQLQHLLEAALDLFLQECTRPELIHSGHLGGVLKLRKLKYFSLLLNTFVDREDLRASKHLHYAQELALVKALGLLTECSEHVPNDSFKKFYIEQIIVTLLKTLTKLYRLHFGNKPIKGEELTQHFGKFMEISSEEAINCVCELMRAFLLKKFPSMAGCPALASCYQFSEALPPLGQQHIAACARIEELLASEASLEPESREYFAPADEEEGEADYEQFARNMLEEQQAKHETPELV
jgi:hypothetical protein